MADSDRVVSHVHAAFRDVPHPGDAFLQGSFEGSEPGEMVEAFRGVGSWADLDARVLDENYTALSMLSEGGFRFVLPAYLVADLQGSLMTADPVFHLTHGFSSDVVRVQAGPRWHERALGGSAFVNPRRYGAMTWEDHARARLSVFPLEEAAMIVAYLEHKRDVDTEGVDSTRIEAALDSFWRERATTAPTQTALRLHLRAEEQYLSDLSDEAE